MIALLLFLTFAAAPHRPNPDVTPGLTRPLSLHTVCTTRWGRDRRHVTEAMRRQVFKAYGIPYSRHAQYELDHLIPRSLAGADDVLNLWPQPLGEATHEKDPLEVKLGKLVCAGSLKLEDAQEAIRSNWPAAHRLYVR